MTQSVGRESLANIQRAFGVQRGLRKSADPWTRHESQDTLVQMSIFDKKSLGCATSHLYYDFRPHSVVGGGQPNKGFVRLNSLEDDDHLDRNHHHPSTMHLSKSEPASFRIPVPGADFHSDRKTEAEEKWFGNYSSDSGRSKMDRASETRPPRGHVQMPYNLNEGHFERWTVRPHLSESASSGMLHVAQPHSISVGYVPSNCIVLETESEPWQPHLLTSPTQLQEFGAQVSHFVGSFFDSFTSMCHSSLNPNAQPFTPLNPNAAEFHPHSMGSCGSTTASETSSVADSSEEITLGPFSPGKLLSLNPNQNDSKCVTPIADEATKEELLRAVGTRKQTPWVAREGEMSALPLSEDLPPTVLGEDANVSAQSSAVEDSDVTNSPSPSRPGHPRLHLLTRRTRSLSSCSSEDGSFIEFSADAPTAGGVKRTVSINEEEDEDDSDDEEDEDDDEEESDWDEVDDVCSWADIPEEFQVSPFECPMEIRKTPQPEIKIEEPEVEESDHIRAANQRWKRICLEPSTCVKVLAKGALVSFTAESTWDLIPEDPEESEDLRAARKSDFPERAADKARMDRMIGRILQPDHRKKMFQLIHGQDLDL